MLRVVVFINQTPIIDTHAVRQYPESPKEGETCVYRTDTGTVLKKKYKKGPGAARLAIELLKDYVRGGR